MCTKQQHYFRHKQGKQYLVMSAMGFRSVVVITCALRAQCPRFEPGRNHINVCLYHYGYHDCNLYGLFMAILTNRFDCGTSFVQNNNFLSGINKNNKT